MDNNVLRNRPDSAEYATIVTENRLLRASFSWMALALFLTTITSYLFAFIPSLTSFLFVESAEGLRPSTLAYVVMFAPLIFVLVMNFALNRLSVPALIGLFVAYSVVNGISFSFIFMVYDIGSIAKVFFSTTALFVLMAVAGYTTRTDLTKLGSILIIGLIGILVASLINFFMHSDSMDYVISILGVVIFTGLTAYDVQKLKNIGYQVQGGTLGAKLGIIGALTLYLDFINLFLFLLRLFGGKRD